MSASQNNPRKWSRREVLEARRNAVLRARTDLIAFAQLMHPDPAYPDVPVLSRYRAAKHHHVIADYMMRVEAGDIPALDMSAPPRHGKTELVTKLFSAWYIGRNPHKSIIIGSYNEKYAIDLGQAVRAYIESAPFAQVFPNVALRTGSRASDRMTTTAGGMIATAGRGGTITGRGGDIVILDDPIKGSEEAASQATRDKLWTWYLRDIRSRGMTDEASVVLMSTRWHMDDLHGRLIDPTNEYYDPMEAKRWTVVNFPALAVGDQDVLGRKKGEALWPSRFSADWLRQMERSDPVGFSALYQGSPTPPGGLFFDERNIVEYDQNELPQDLRIYASSDHATSTLQHGHLTCLMPVGIDSDGVIWVLPDVYWRKVATDIAVDAMLDIIRRRKPVVWWAENTQVSKSIGPFLRKRMIEEQVFCSIHEVYPSRDKPTRAQSIQARMAMRRVRFPRFAPWWREAKEQLLHFPNGSADDFVDALSLIGLGLDRLVAAGSPASRAVGPKRGTLAWVKADHYARQRKERARASLGGW